MSDETWAESAAYLGRELSQLTDHSVHHTARSVQPGRTTWSLPSGPHRDKAVFLVTQGLANKCLRFMGRGYTGYVKFEVACFSISLR